MTGYYDRQGQPISVGQWSRAFERDDRSVGFTVIDPEVEVSTVYMGLDHNPSAKGPPLIFETMIFGGPLDQETWRYSTEAEALAGHEEAVRQHHEAVKAVS